MQSRGVLALEQNLTSRENHRRDLSNQTYLTSGIHLLSNKVTSLRSNNAGVAQNQRSGNPTTNNTNQSFGNTGDWFRSQKIGPSNPNEDTGNQNANCAFTCMTMLGIHFNKLPNNRAQTDSQIEQMRKLCGSTPNEQMGEKFPVIEKGLKKLGLKANFKTGTTLAELKNGISQGKKFILAVTPGKYLPNGGTNGHAVVLAGFEGNNAILYDPGGQAPIKIPASTLMSAMKDQGNQSIAVSA